MCGRYTVNTEDEIIELREILQEISRRLMKENDGNENAGDADRKLLRCLSSEYLRIQPKSIQNIPVELESAKQLSLFEDTGDFNGTNAVNGIEAYPSCLAPVILPDMEIKQVKWGFPKWDSKKVIFNARSEGIASGKFFSPYLTGGRCLVPAASYFEWIRINNKPADKFRIFNDDNSFLFMAGLFRKSVDKSMEFVIVTRAAAQNISFIHHRMPVVLKYEYALEWLSGGFSDEIFKQVADVSFLKQTG